MRHIYFIRYMIMKSIVPILVLGNILLAQWEPDYRLTANDSLSITNINNAWCIANGTSNDVHVVWYDKRDGNCEIYYRRSLDNGLTWSADTRLSFTGDSSFYPAVAVGGSVVHVIWLEAPTNEIRYKRSLDYGANWTPDTSLDWYVPAYDNACISAQNRFAAITWTNGGGDIGCVCSQNSGLTWSNASFLPAYDYPSVAVQDSEVHIVRNNSNRYQLLYNRSTDCGITWLPLDTISSGNDIRTPSIAVCDSIVHVVWRDNQGVWVTKYSRSTDGGSTWSTGIVLGQGMYASISCWINNIYVIRNHDNNMDLAYLHSSDFGATWSVDTTLVYPQGGYFSYPSIDCSDSLVNIVWRDARDGNSEIYYKRNPTAGVGINEDAGITQGDEPGKFIALTPTFVKGSFYIKLHKPLTGSKELKLYLYNAYGSCVWQNAYRCNSGQIVVKDKKIAQLPSGVYFCRMMTDGYMAVEKVVMIK